MTIPLKFIIPFNFKNKNDLNHHLIEFHYFHLVKNSSTLVILNFILKNLTMKLISLMNLHN